MYRIMLWVLSTTFLVGCDGAQSPAERPGLVDDRFGAPVSEQELEVSCEQGESLACHELVYRRFPKELHRYGIGAPGNNPRMLQLLETACRSGFFDACVHVYNANLGANRTWDVHDVEVLERVCQLGFPPACWRAGELTLREEPRRAAQAFLTAELLGSDATRALELVASQGVDVAEMEPYSPPWVVTRSLALEKPTSELWSQRDELCRKDTYPLCKVYLIRPKLKHVRFRPGTSLADKKHFRALQSLCSRDDHGPRHEARCQRAGEHLYQRFREALRNEGGDLKAPSNTAVLWLEQACLNHHQQACRVLGNLAFLNGSFHLAKRGLLLGRFDYPLDLEVNLLKELISKRNFY